MPRKERPVPLSDSIFQKKLGPTDEAPTHPSADAIPVRNTFIHFGASEGLADTRESITTAPARIGPCFQSAMEMVVQSRAQANCNEPVDRPDSNGGQEPDHDPLAAIGSPKKVPSTHDCLSSSCCSARAAGLSSGSTADVTGSTTDRSLPQSGSGTGTTDKPDDDEVLDDEDDDASESDNENAGQHEQPVLPGELPSLGSEKHAKGLCKRCCFFPKGRCNHGYDCEFCHYQHEKRRPKNKKKQKKRRRKEKKNRDAPCTVLSTPSEMHVEEMCDDLVGSGFLEMGKVSGHPSTAHYSFFPQGPETPVAGQLELLAPVASQQEPLLPQEECEQEQLMAAVMPEGFSGLDKETIAQRLMEAAPWSYDD